MPAEPDGLQILSILLSILMIILSALYAGADSALSALSVGQIKKESEADEKKAKALQEALERQTGAVTPLQSGLVFCALLGMALWTAGGYSVLYPAFSGFANEIARCVLSFAVASVAYLIIFAIFGNILPKKSARKAPLSFGLRRAGLFLNLTRLAMPFLLLCAHTANGILRLCRIDPKALDNAVTEEEILQMVGEGEEKGVIEETERDMITNILDFNDTTAEETMTHRTDIAAVEDTAPISEIITVAVENGYSRVPVYHEDIDSVVGICYVKDLLPYVGRDLPDFITLKDLMRPAYFVPETKKCSQLFTEMTERKVQIAIVVDEYGGTAGLVTLEDLVESIVGNIQDEYDHEEEEIHRMSETEFTVDGTTSIDEISGLTDTELPEGDYDTIAGLVTEQLGIIPKENEHPQIEINGLTITVLEVEDQRLSKLLIVKKPQETEDEEE